MTEISGVPAYNPREAERGREAWTLGQGMKKPVAGCYGRLTRWKGGGDVVYMALL
nr:Relaxase/helicase [uncultured bacterium]